MRFQWQLLLSARGSATGGCGRQRLCCGRWVLPSWPGWFQFIPSSLGCPTGRCLLPSMEPASAGRAPSLDTSVKCPYWRWGWTGTDASKQKVWRPCVPLVKDPIVQQPFLFLHLGWVWAPQLSPRDQYPTWQAKIRESFTACCPQPPFFLTLPSSPLILWTSGVSFSPRLTFCYYWPLCCLGSTGDGHKGRW